MMSMCVCVVVDIGVLQQMFMPLLAENVSDLCVAHACASVLVSVYMHCVFVYVYLWEPCWSSLAKQRSVQYRSDVGWADLTEPRPSTNPAVFRSPGPYLMSLGKKRFSLSLFPLSFPLVLSFSLSFSHAPPLKPQPCLEPVCKWMSSKCLLSSYLSLSLSLPSHLSQSTLTDIAEVDIRLNFKHLLQHRKVQLE